MNNWLQSLNESYQNLKEEQELSNALTILAEQLYKDEPSLTEEEIKFILSEYLMEMLAPENWAERHGPEAGATRQRRKDFVARARKDAEAAVTPASRGTIIGALKSLLPSQKRMRALHQHDADFLAKQLVLKPEERHESLRGIKDKHIRAHIEQRAKAAQAREVHDQLGGDNSRVVPEKEVRDFMTKTGKDAVEHPAHQTPGMSTARRSKGSRLGYEPEPRYWSSGETDSKNRIVYRKDFGTGAKVSDDELFADGGHRTLAQRGIEQSSLNRTTGKVLTGNEQDQTAHTYRGMKLAMRRGGTLKTSGVDAESGARVDVTTPATTQNIFNRAKAITSAGEGAVARATKAGDAERAAKKQEEAAKQEALKAAQRGIEKPSEPPAQRPSGRKPRKPRN